MRTIYPLFSEFNYRVVHSNLKHYAEVLVTYKFKGRDARRVLYFEDLEHDGGDAFFTAQAKREIEKEIKNDYLYHHSKKYLRIGTLYNLKVAVISVVCGCGLIVGIIALVRYIFKS